MSKFFYDKGKTWVRTRGQDGDATLFVDYIEEIAITAEHPRTLCIWWMDGRQKNLTFPDPGDALKVAQAIREVMDEDDDGEGWKR